MRLGLKGKEMSSSMEGDTFIDESWIDVYNFMNEILRECFDCPIGKQSLRQTVQTMTIEKSISLSNLAVGQAKRYLV